MHDAEWQTISTGNDIGICNSRRIINYRWHHKAVPLSRSIRNIITQRYVEKDGKVSHTEDHSTLQRD